MSEEAAKRIAAKCWENNPTRGMAEREAACYEACIEMEKQTIAEVLAYAEELVRGGIISAHSLAFALNVKFGKKNENQDNL